MHPAFSGIRVRPAVRATLLLKIARQQSRPFCRAWYRPCDLGDEAKRPQCLGMMTFTNVPSLPSDHPVPFPISYGWRWLPTWPVSGAPPATTLRPTCAAAWPGAQNTAWTRWPHAARIWSCTSGGCRRSAGSSPRRCHGGSRSPPGSTGPASLMACWNTHPPSVSGGPPYRHNRQRWDSPTCSSRPCSPPPGNRRTRATSRWSRCSACSGCGSSKPPARISPTSARNTVTGCCAYAAKAPRSSWSRCRRGRPGHRPGSRRPRPRADPAQQPRCADGPPRRDPPPAAPG